MKGFLISGGGVALLATVLALIWSHSDQGQEKSQPWKLQMVFDDPQNLSLRFPGAFSSADCDAILRLLSEPPQAGEAGSTHAAASFQSQQSRVAAIRGVPYDESMDWVYDRIGKFVGKANNMLWHLNLEGAETMQLSSYRAAESPHTVPASHGQYSWHVDESGKDHTGRLLSVTVQLSAAADYGGGDFVVGTHFASRVRGDLVVFPSHAIHAVLPVTRGERHSLVSWWHGPLNGTYKSSALSGLRCIQRDAKSLSQFASRDHVLGLHEVYGMQLLHVGEVAAATSMLEETLAEDPNRPQALSNLASALYSQGDVEKAVSYLRRALAISPGDLRMQRNLKTMVARLAQ